MRPPQGQTDTQFIQNFFAVAGGYRDDAPYWSIPFGPYFNSNSYVAGILRTAGTTPPDLPGLKPGYDKPLPL